MPNLKHVVQVYDQLSKSLQETRDLLDLVKAEEDEEALQTVADEVEKL